MCKSETRAAEGAVHGNVVMDTGDETRDDFEVRCPIRVPGEVMEPLVFNLHITSRTKDGHCVTHNTPEAKSGWKTMSTSTSGDFDEDRGYGWLGMT